MGGMQVVNRLEIGKGILVGSKPGGSRCYGGRCHRRKNISVPCFPVLVMGAKIVIYNCGTNGTGGRDGSIFPKVR